MKKIIGVALLLLSVEAVGDDVTCPDEMISEADANEVTIEWHPHGRYQQIANIYLPRENKRKELKDVNLYVGDARFNKDGKQIETPIISASLNIREHKGNPMVQVIIANETSNARLNITYGNFCGHTISYKITHNKLLQPTADASAE